jgi:hypothetical protein
MRSYPFATIILLLAALLCPAEASAQSAAPAASAAEFDFRIGELRPQEGNRSGPTLGGRLALYFWPGTLDGRLSLQIVGDYRPIGRDESFDEVFRTRSLTEEYLVAMGPSLGVDLLRRPHLVIDARVGGLVVRERTNFSINSADGFVYDNDAYENVCPYQGFRERCRSDYDLTATASIGLRAYLRPNQGLFVGVDYTGLSRGQQLLVGSIGVRLR